MSVCAGAHLHEHTCESQLLFNKWLSSFFKKSVLYLLYFNLLPGSEILGKKVSLPHLSLIIEAH